MSGEHGTCQHDGVRAAVVIPVHADPDGLRDTLVALAGEDAAVTVVVDGPHPATEAVGRDLGATVLVQENAGSYAARQRGVDSLPDDVDAVLFTDAGCVPRPGWVAAHVAALGAAALSGGAVDVVTRAKPSPAEWVDKQRYLRQEAYVADGYSATCNLGVRRAVLRDVRFDTTLRSGGDRDFCRRAGDAGHRLVFTPDAVIAHPARSTAKAVLAKARRIGTGLGALPDSNRPPALPVPYLRRGLARAGMRATGRGVVWGAQVMVLDWWRMRTTRRAILAGGWTPPGEVHAVVLLNARWSSLEEHNTRWRRVIQAWADHPAIGGVTVIDYPSFRPRRLARPVRLVRSTPSWLGGVRAFAVDVPLPPRPTVIDALVWWWVARSVERVLPPGPRVVVATTPLWVPLAARLRADASALDGMGDWRALPAVQRQRRRIEAGYAEAKELDVVTVVSPGLADVLAELCPVVVGNGVDLAAFAGAPEPFDGLPSEPFAVYVGAVESRVDVDLLDAVAAAGLPVVVAGPASGATAERLRTGPLHWLGPVPTDRVPDLLRHAAVGLVPHHVGPLTASMDPMKVLEYLAAGLPVVSTPVALPADVAPLVTVVEPAGFAAAAVDGARRGRGKPDETALTGRDWTTVAATLLDRYRRHG
jgi:glycosyltransferase involved in cell wall biosynthesis